LDVLDVDFSRIIGQRRELFKNRSEVFRDVSRRRVSAMVNVGPVVHFFRLDLQGGGGGYSSRGR
jgi:hypothetical protein